MKSGHCFSNQLPNCILLFLSHLINNMSNITIPKIVKILWKSKNIMEKFNCNQVRFWTFVCQQADEETSQTIVKQLLHLFEESLSSTQSCSVILTLLLSLLSINNQFKNFEFLTTRTKSSYKTINSNIIKKSQGHQRAHHPLSRQQHHQTGHKL
eukprot:UN25862